MYTLIVFIPTSNSIVKNTVITQYLRIFLLVFTFYSVCNKTHDLFISAIFIDRIKRYLVVILNNET